MGHAPGWSHPPPAEGGLESGVGGSISPESLDAVEEPALPILVDGDWRDSEAQETLPVYNPARGTVLTRVPLCPPEEVDQAVRSAGLAFPAWRDTPPAERAQVLFRLKQALEAHQDDLARMVAVESGALLSEARAEVSRGIAVVALACGTPSLLSGETAAVVAGGLEGRSLRVPLGVVAGLCQLDLPALVPLWTASVAVGAGNAVVLKPSERTPMTAVRLAELFVEAGLPAGVLSLVHGGQPAADALLDHPEVRAASFAGPEAEARRACVRAAASGKRIRAMAALGNHLVVLPDADMALAAGAAVETAFGRAGRLAGGLLVAVGDAAGPLLERVRAEVEALRPGDPLDEASTVGPLVRPGDRERVAAYLESALGRGARLVVDGRARIPGRGFFLGPAVLEVGSEGALAGGEIPGPLLVSARAATLEEALALLSRFRPGGSASLFTRSGEAARLFRARAAAGAVGVNVALVAPMSVLASAGWRPFPGDLPAAGQEAVRFFTEARVIVERWP